MLIVLAGMIGAGKSTIARQISERLSIPLHSIDDDKIEIGQRYAQYPSWLAHNIPFPDDFRREVFSKTLERLRELAKSHQHVIVEETFHKKAIRDPFFEEASQILGEILLTFVTVDDKVVKERLDKRSKEEGHIVGYGMYLAFKAAFEPFEQIDYGLKNDENIEKELAKYLAFLREKLKLPFE